MRIVPIKSILRKYLRMLNPAPPIGGLAVTDTALRFISIQGENKFASASLRLPPGIISAGRIINRAQFVTALQNLHKQIAGADKTIHVVLDIPPNMAYTQTFSIPLLAENKIEEAARLNLEMISPIDIKNSYASWQRVGSAIGENGQIELLGAFAEAALVDAFGAALKEANFMITAVEFPALALSRLVRGGIGGDPAKPYVFIEVSAEGVSMMIIRSLNLSFNYFHSWQSIQDEMGLREITKEGISNFLVREVQKMMNFYASRWGGTIANAILASTGLIPEITKILEENFSLEVVNLSLESASFTSSWFPALGSAMRGLVAQSRDTFISLTNASVKTQYWQAQILSFISWWRRIVITVTAFILVLLAGTDFFLMRYERALSVITEQGSQSKEIAEVKTLEARAKDFNASVALALAAKDKVIPWTAFFELMNRLAAQDVALDKIVVDDSGAALNGSAATEEAVLRFKERLLKESNFDAVSLPLSKIKPGLNGGVTFDLDLHFKSLKFQ